MAIGPDRILALSQNTTQRNAQIAQEGTSWNGRVRDRAGNANGTSDQLLGGTAVAGAPTHVAFTFVGGTSTLYVDGALADQEQLTGTDLTTWSRDFPLLIGNEQGAERMFRGTVHLAAIYARALSAREVNRHRGQGAPRLRGGADGDADGVPDADDVCPDVPDALQLDADADDIGDACEP